jgi:hypothetical protein
MSDTEGSLGRIWRQLSQNAVIMTMIASLTLLWPAVMNGGAFWFPDTSSYVRGADAAVMFVSGIETEWSDRLVKIGADAPQAASPGDAASAAGADSASDVELRPERPVLLGRSIYYGFLLYLPLVIGGEWLAILLQALIVGGAITWCLRTVLKEHRPEMTGKAPWALPLLAIFTPASFYACMLMPDIYAGVLIAMLATIVVYWNSLSKSEKWMMAAFSAALVTFHTVHLLLVAGVTGLAVLFALSASKNRLRPALLGLCLIATGMIASSVFSSAIQYSLKQPPIGPPFLTARMMDSGPGLGFLDEKCSAASLAGSEALAPSDYALCAHRAKLPLPSDDFLWSYAQGKGLFQLLPPDQQRQVASEDKRLFLAIAFSDPLGFVGASLKSTFTQLSQFGMPNFNYSAGNRAGFADKLPDAMAQNLAASRAANGTIPERLIGAIALFSTLAALAFGLFTLTPRGKPSDTASTHIRYWAILIVGGVLANAAITGALSGPHDRYQMRLIWLIPMAAWACWAYFRIGLAPHSNSSAAKDKRA